GRQRPAGRVTHDPNSLCRNRRATQGDRGEDCAVEGATESAPSGGCEGASGAQGRNQQAGEVRAGSAGGSGDGGGASGQASRNARSDQEQLSQPGREGGGGCAEGVPPVAEG